MQEMYNSKTPPEYDISRIRDVPIALFYGSTDLIADVQDVEVYLMQRLSPGTLVFSKKIPGYAHLDYTWSVDAHTQIYEDILQLVHQYNPVTATA